MFCDAPVMIDGKEKFYYEINIDERYGEGIVDAWGAAYVWNKDGNGAEYNIYYDGKNEYSAIYKMCEDSTDSTTYQHYEIDFSDADWKERLIKQMIACAKEWFDEGN